MHSISLMIIGDCVVDIGLRLGLFAFILFYAVDYL